MLFEMDVCHEQFWPVILTQLRKSDVSCSPVYYTDTPKFACGVFCHGVQKEEYENSRLKKPCNAYALFMKVYAKNKAHDLASARQVISAGRLASV